MEDGGERSYMLRVSGGGREDIAKREMKATEKEMEEGGR